MTHRTNNGTVAAVLKVDVLLGTVQRQPTVAFWHFSRLGFVDGLLINRGTDSQVSSQRELLQLIPAFLERAALFQPVLDPSTLHSLLWHTVIHTGHTDSCKLKRDALTRHSVDKVLGNLGWQTKWLLYP